MDVNVVMTSFMVLFICDTVLLSAREAVSSAYWNMSMILGNGLRSATKRI